MNDALSMIRTSSHASQKASAPINISKAMKVVRTIARSLSSWIFFSSFMTVASLLFFVFLERYHKNIILSII